MNKQRWYKYIIFILLTALLPLIIDNQYIISILVTVGIYLIAVEGLTLLVGFGGQSSFGHAGFFILGAYCSVLISKYTGISPWISLVAGAIVAGIAGVMVGVPTLKLKGHFLAFGTLAFAMMIFFMLNQMSWLTGGPAGLGNIEPLSIGDFEFYGEQKYYYLVWLFVIIGIFIAENIVSSSFGKNIKTIKESELLAEHLKINTSKEKVKLFVISSIYAGFAGGLYAYYMLYLSPVTGKAETSVLFLSMAIVGGLTNVWGALVGTMVLMVIGEIMKNFLPIILPDAGGEIEMLAYGIILTSVLIFMPEGIVPKLAKLRNLVPKKNVKVNRSKNTAEVKREVA